MNITGLLVLEHDLVITVRQNLLLDLGKCHTNLISSSPPSCIIKDPYEDLIRMRKSYNFALKCKEPKQVSYALANWGLTLNHMIPTFNDPEKETF